MTGFSRLSVRETVRRVTDGEGGAVGVCAEALERIAAYDAVQPQAWIERFSPAEVLDQARRVDARLAAGEILPLAGATFAVKDNIDVAGLPTTAAVSCATWAKAGHAAVVGRPATSILSLTAKQAPARGGRSPAASRASTRSAWARMSSSANRSIQAWGWTAS